MKEHPVSDQISSKKNCICSLPFLTKMFQGGIYLIRRFRFGHGILSAGPVDWPVFHSKQQLIPCCLLYQFIFRIAKQKLSSCL
jgi:hypothetical protein